MLCLKLLVPCLSRRSVIGRLDRLTAVGNDCIRGWRRPGNRRDFVGIAILTTSSVPLPNLQLPRASFGLFTLSRHSVYIYLVIKAERTGTHKVSELVPSRNYSPTTVKPRARDDGRPPTGYKQCSVRQGRYRWTSWGRKDFASASSKFSSIIEGSCGIADFSPLRSV